MRTSVRLITVAGAIALSGCLTSQNINPTATQLRAQADAWDRAIVRKDVAAISQNMADTFRHIDSEGHLSNKAQFLSGITSDKLVIHPYEPEDVEIRFYGDVAIMTGTTRLQGAYDGKSFKTYYRYSDTYFRESGIWRIINVQTSEIAK